MKDATHDSFKELYEARHEPENLRPIAELYWRALLVTAVIAIVGIIVFGIWEFSAVIAIISSSNASVSAQQAPAIDRTQLESTLNQFSERKATFEMSKSMVPAVADPSK